MSSAIEDSRAPHQAWAALPYGEWKDTCRTLHLWSQIIGKVRLAQTPWLNHSWQAPLYLSTRGLSTGLVPHGTQTFDIEFDFVDRRLRIRTDSRADAFALEPMSVCGFYRRVMDGLDGLGLPVQIHAAPNELPEATPFAEDTAPRMFDPVAAERFWRVLLQADRVLKQFRTAFLGKASPVHFFWGSFDLAVTRFSGRRAPLHPGGIPHLPDAVTREAYSHEVSSAGFWPGGDGHEEAAFYAYAYPEPPGFRDAVVAPAQARFDASLGEYLLPYEVVRTASDPDAVLMAFLQSTYAAAADAGGWDRAQLECQPGIPGHPRAV